ncbi:MAG: hypothetical protein DRI79_07715 [Chloroflexi bacterium]|nr:MAG: hypothetical protein DRI79_07715 [Chloroflexota bacterium]
MKRNQRRVALISWPAFSVLAGSVSNPAAVLRAERTTFLDTDEVIEFSLATCCGEWYRLSMLLEPVE